MGSPLLRMIRAVLLSSALAMACLPPAWALEKFQFGASFRGSPRYDLLAWVLEEKGFWKAQGLQVEWVPFRGGATLYAAMAAKRITMGVSTTAAFFHGAAQGLPVIIVADLKSQQYFSLWVKADGPIKEAKDLKGGKIGIGRMGDAGHAGALMTVRALGLEKDAKFVAVGGFQERIAALKTGSIQAFAQTISPVANLAARGEVRELISTKPFLPQGFIDYVTVARKDFVDARTELAGKVLRALLAGTQYIGENPERTLQLLREKFGYSEKGALLALGELGLSKDGEINKKGLEETLDYYVSFGFVAKEKVPPLEELYTSRLLP